MASYINNDYPMKDWGIFKRIRFGALFLKMGNNDILGDINYYRKEYINYLRIIHGKTKHY